MPSDPSEMSPSQSLKGFNPYNMKSQCAEADQVLITLVLLFVYIYIYTYLYVYIYVHIHMRSGHLHVCMHVCTYVSTGRYPFRAPAKALWMHHRGEAAGEEGDLLPRLQLAA